MIEKRLSFIRDQFAGRYLVIPNSGSWENEGLLYMPKDKTDYSRGDGVMFEGCGVDELVGQYGSAAGWRLQLARWMTWANAGKVVLCQPAAAKTPATRMLVLATYLIAKANYTYMNYDGAGCRWYPEYEVPVGTPAESFEHPDDARVGDVYVRRYSNGMALVNPNPTQATFTLSKTLHNVTAHGGGAMPDTGVPPDAWRLSTNELSGKFILPPRSGAVLLKDPTAKRKYSTLGD